MESFALDGSKWGNPTFGTFGGQVTWSFATTVGYAFEFDYAITAPAFQHLIRLAYDAWEAVADIDFVEVEDSPNSMMRLAWEDIDGPYELLGETYFSASAEDGVNFSIDYAEIRFDSWEDWSTDRNYVGDLVNFYTTAVHEIGHAIGLSHVDDPTQIMYPILNDEIELGLGDIAGVQTLYGAAHPDGSVATHGNDIFTLTSGNDTFDGLSGVDTVVFDTTRSAIVVTKEGGKIITTGQGVDVFTNIERFQFSDGTLAFDTSGNAGQAYRIYKAAFARTPDNDGLKYWINTMDGGADLINVSGGFVDSAEYKNVYGSDISNSGLVNKLYLNVLGRDGEPGGVAFWTEELDSGNRDVATVLADISESAENVATVGAVIDDGIFYT